MVGVMIRMKLSILRNGSSTRRLVGGAVGLALAVLTVLVSVFAPMDAVVSLLATVLGVWLVCWVAGPSGGSGGDESLRPEYFALEPVPLRTVMVGLLASSFVGVTVPVTAVASLSLFTLAIRFGPLAALAAVVAVPLTVIVIVLCSRVFTAMVGAAMRTRIGVEISAIQSAAVLAAGFSIFMIYQAVSQYTDVFALLWNEGVAAPYSTVALALPSGWGVFAVRAAGEGSPLLALGALLGLLVLALLLLTVWGVFVRRRVSSPTTGPARSGRGVTHLLQRFLPTGPMGAVITRELRTWGKDPRRALELRVALWTGVLVCAMGLLVGMTFMIPLAGLIMVAMAALMSLNVYALDGSALWQTLLSPGAERRDVRGRQITWLLVFVPVSVLVSVGGILFTGQDWAWPWVAAVLPALIGAGAGLSVLFAVMWPAPGPEPHRHGGSPLASGDPSGQFTVLFPLLLVCSAPPAALTALGVFTGNQNLVWAAIAFGVAEGLLLGWGLGRVAYRRLEKRGPELLNTLRWGWDATAGKSVEQVAEERSGSDSDAAPAGSEDEAEWALFTRLERNLDTLSGRAGTALTVLGLTFWLPLYQGAASLIGVLAGTESPSWHLPLHLPAPFQLPAALGMLLLGAVMVGAMLRILFRPLPEGVAVPGNGDGPETADPAPGGRGADTAT
ncbi:hypothetical protein NE857_00740 [Nocardiopsis exhalans]|uniref:ABC-2 type transport system permease protein n=1 Tax=Nocardiopsis exhalans TaxID=163604 RepID=A0ABY5D7A4_9ACTN|nr:hypothetical protein [Nocardiopsis exhalans]USY20234.1 hypothetical protein NE857_00740 [Nocardiopsis exhalans]